MQVLELHRMETTLLRLPLGSQITKTADLDSGGPSEVMLVAVAEVEDATVAVMEEWWCWVVVLVLKMIMEGMVKLEAKVELGVKGVGGHGREGD